MQSIKKSECPRELEPADRRSPVHVNLMRRDEKCPVSVLSRSVIFVHAFRGSSKGNLISHLYDIDP